VKYSLKQVLPGIFLVKCRRQYDLAMLFLRCQEFYESPNPKFRGQAFELVDYMEWYSKQHGNGAFTYPKDWTGFNIPGEVIFQCHQSNIPDWNRYDDLIEDIWLECNELSKSKEMTVNGWKVPITDIPFYVIGVFEGGYAYDHEIAHGLYFTSPMYKAAAKRLIREMPSKVRIEMRTTLKNLGYGSNVLNDELQAYMATGLARGAMKKIVDIKPARKSFQVLFRNQL
jgi:hypothetical protein